MTSSASAIEQRAAAGDPIRVGIVGLGASGSWAGRAHVPALSAVAGYELRALSASTAESAKRAGDAHDVALTFGSAGELAACDEVDLVVVSVKVPHHHELVAAALDSGTPVLCEWPLGNGTEEAEDLARRAREGGVPTAVGLQARSNPAIGYLRDLVSDGFVGDVLSTTVVGSGGSWGPVVDSRNRYLLDPTNGATLRTIPFGHTLDGVAAVLGEPTELRIVESSRRLEATDTDTGEHVPAPAPDQVTATGTLPNGVVASFHYRGGLSRGTNFRWEINGTDGDVVVTAPTGHLQLAPITVTGARGDDQDLSPLPVPERYVHVPGLDPVRDSPAYAVAHAYHQLLADLRARTSTVPDFDHAVRRHHSIEPLDGRP
jgi:predicted dehydrogenase